MVLESMIPLVGQLLRMVIRVMERMKRCENGAMTRMIATISALARSVWETPSFRLQHQRGFIFQASQELP